MFITIQLRTITKEVAFAERHATRCCMSFYQGEEGGYRTVILINERAPGVLRKRDSYWFATTHKCVAEPSLRDARPGLR